MNSRHIFPAFFLFICSFIAQPALSQKPNDPLKWKKEIEALEQSDQKPEPGAIVFTGSSSIRMWQTLKQDFPDRPVVNRGFGGSQIEDAVYYFDQLVTQYQPKQVVLYAGDNDIASEKTPEMVLEDFKKFAGNMKEKLPKAELVYLAIKPSIARWNMYPDMQKANKKIKRYAFWHKRVKFVDVATPMLGADGKPRPELYISDGLHMTSKGYELWTSVLEPHLAK